MKPVLLVLMLALASLLCTLTGLIAPAASTPVAASYTPSVEYVPSIIIPTDTPTYTGCAYAWGTKDLPDLSNTLNAGLQKMDKRLSGYAYAYGENCVYGDGTQTFSALETDFRVAVQVKDVRNQDDMGNWMDYSMRVILALPAADLEGIQPGRVEFQFNQADPRKVYVTVPIEVYRREALHLTGIALFRLFYKPDP